jgi:protein-S-isoprenylcysteine O-methyltransferase Ste14
MHPAAKIIIGLILLIIGLGLFVDSVVPIMGTTGTFGIDWLANFIIVVTGVIPIFLILIGLFVIWLEMDELKTERELKKEDEKEEKPKKTKKK